MLDIKGRVVNIGDKVLLSYQNGFVLTTFKKETKSSFLFDGGNIIAKFVKLTYVGDAYMHPDGTQWDFRKHGRIDYSMAKHKYLGDNNTCWKLKDMTNEKQVRVLLVDKDFEL